MKPDFSHLASHITDGLISGELVIVQINSNSTYTELIILPADDAAIVKREFELYKKLNPRASKLETNEVFNKLIGKKEIR